MEQVAMVKGLDVFREHFRDFQHSYVLIGGVACYLAMEEAGVDFRATKDLDIVLCAEALDSAFVAHFWEFVKAGGYQNQQKSTGGKQFYRFDKPATEGFPFMLELFSRVPDQLSISDEAHLTPIPAGEEISSLSAILLDGDYYQCIQNGKIVIDDIPVLGAEFILPFKARAWLDLTQRKQAGGKVDSKAIKKHRNDVFRLSVLLAPTQRVDMAETIKQDLS
ncbi:MAG: hypothetical protein KZQ88_09335 [Candidatus Thiodiazotropha sp. (ex Dulcina madagascariensis)]|nr:hypothetical protein [Candidatus Thiodiazotropha sp. (ex Dulcina madagascariensis)]MCU7926624.1 hypothetical protein [Candidatus Thiodiazotropha sp. (ex Dulcina madagascariensis)]